MALRPGGHPDTVIVWFRRDLRVADHPALDAAAALGRAVVPLFVLDERLVGPARAPARSWFLRRSLAELDTALRERGSGLLVQTGRPEVVVPEVARATGATVVLAARDVAPFARRRDRAVASALERDGRRLHLQPGLLLSEPEGLLNAAGEPCRVFTPFWRALEHAERRTVLKAPTRIDSPPGVFDGPGPQAVALALDGPPHGYLPAPGGSAARARLGTWLVDGLAGYGDKRDQLAGEHTSRLGQDLHFGLLSPLEVETAAREAGDRATPFLRQIAWREFYHHRLFHQQGDRAHVPDPALMDIFRAETVDPEAVAAWREGRTGIPVVDAGMRQLSATSWLSDRARLIVASFLTRHLLMDYRIGERHFMRHLIDGDVANNLGGWQWTAGVGADPQPWFRIFNPVLQGQRFDPDGAWVRQWLPELSRVPARFIHAPWEMPMDVASDAGLQLGSSYPRPIVDLAAARQEALAAFRSAVGRGTSASLATAHADAVTPAGVRRRRDASRT